MELKRLGIIGAENSHSVNIAEICNNLQKVPVRVTHIWGETAEYAEKAATQGKIPNIVADWKQMLGEVDGIMIDHRDGRLHAEPAEFFIAKGVPSFVDKPMTCDLAGSKKLLRLGEQHKTPVLTFSSKALQQGFVGFARKLKEMGRLLAVNTSGPGDINSQWGGIFFYGIHQVDSIVELMGTDAKSAGLQASGKNAVATINYADGRFATMNFLNEGAPEFHWYAHTEKAALLFDDKYDELPYLSSAQLIHGLLAKGEVPFTRERMLAPIAILDALAKSLKSGKPEPVESL